jgi:hypothetical protein
MKLSDTQRIVLSHGAQHPQLLAIAPKHLPVAACRAVVNSLIKSRLLIEVAAPRDQLAMVWRKDADGTPILIQVTDEGLRAIGLPFTPAARRLRARDEPLLEAEVPRDKRAVLGRRVEQQVVVAEREASDGRAEKLGREDGRRRELLLMDLVESQQTIILKLQRERQERLGATSHS